MTAQHRWHFPVTFESRGGHVLLPTERRRVVIRVTIRSAFLRSWSASCMLSTSICWKLKDLGSRRWRSPTELKEHGSHAPVHRAFPGGPVVMGASLGAQWRRIYLPMQETQEMQVRSLGQEDPLEGQMETHSGILAWRLQRTEKPGRLWPAGSQKSDMPETTEHPHTHQWLWLRAFIVASQVLSLTGEPRSHKPQWKREKQDHRSFMPFPWKSELGSHPLEGELDLGTHFWNRIRLFLVLSGVSLSGKASYQAIVVVVWSLSYVWFFAIPWTVACQANLSTGLPRQDYWSG